MSEFCHFDPQQGSLTFQGELTIYQISEANAALRAAIDSGQCHRIDLAAVTELDSAGLQLLLAAKRLRTPEGKPAMQLCNHSQPVQAVLTLLNLGNQLDMTVAVESGL